MHQTLKQALAEERAATFYLLRGGYPVPWRERFYWAAIAALLIASSKSNRLRAASAQAS